MTEHQYHQLCREFMDKFDLPKMSLDEFLSEHESKLTESEYKIGKAISDLYNTDILTNGYMVQVGWEFYDEVGDNKSLNKYLNSQLNVISDVLESTCKGIGVLTHCQSGNADYIMLSFVSTDDLDVFTEFVTRKVSDISIGEYLYVNVTEG